MTNAGEFYPAFASRSTTIATNRRSDLLVAISFGINNHQIPNLPRRYDCSVASTEFA